MGADGIALGSGVVVEGACAGGPSTAAASWRRDHGARAEWQTVCGPVLGAMGGVQRATQDDEQAGRQGEGVAVTSSCRVVAGCSMETPLNPPVSRRRSAVSSLAPSIRSALRTAIWKRAPPHCLARARVLTHTRHSARSDSPEAAERWCQAFIVSRVPRHSATAVTASLKRLSAGVPGPVRSTCPRYLRLHRK